MQNVLVTCGGGFQGLGILQALREIDGVRAILADRSPDNIGQWLASKSVLAPSIKDSESYAEFIRDTAWRENVSAIIPATDLDLEILNQLRNWCQEEGIFLAVSAGSLLKVAFDKRELQCFCAEHEIEMLASYTGDLGCPTDLPLIAKPIKGSGSKGQVLIAKGQVPLILLDEPNQYLIQPYVGNAAEYSVDFAINAKDQISPLSIRRRVVNSGGFSIVACFRPEDRVRRSAERAALTVASAGGRGGFNLQFLDVDDIPRLIDLNPRFGTSSVFSLHAGLNLVAFAISAEATPRQSNIDGQVIRLLCERRVPKHRFDIKGVVFDLDDTLIDHKQWIADKLVYLHGRFREALPNRSAFLSVCYRTLEEGNRSRLLSAVGAELGLSDEIVEAMIDSYRKFVPKRIQLFVDVRRTFAELRSRGLKIALLSDNPKASQLQKLDRVRTHFSDSDPFDCVVLTDQLGISKPDPKAFAAVAAGLALDPTDLAMIGDNLYRDALAALDAGYSAGFVIERSGTFFNFSRSLFPRSNKPPTLVSISSLDELLWHVPTP